MLRVDFSEEIKNLALALPDVVVDEATLEGFVIFRLNPDKFAYENPNQLNFAILSLSDRPMLLELASDRNLAKNLCDKYESVSPSKLMDPRRWIRLIGTGQLSEAEVVDLVNLAHRLVLEQHAN